MTPVPIRAVAIATITMFLVCAAMPAAHVANTPARAATMDGPDVTMAPGEMDRLVTQPAGDGAMRVVADDAGHRLTGGRVREVTIGADGTIWVARGSDVLALNVPGRVEPRNTGWRAWPRRLESTPSGVLWAVEDGGTAIALEGRNWSDRSRGERAVGRGLSVLDDGSVWSVLRSDGGPNHIARLDPLGWSVFDAELDLLRGGSGSRYTFARTHDGRVWLGVDGGRYGGLAVFDGVAWKEVRSLGSLVAPRVLNLAAGPGGALWALTDLDTMTHGAGGARYRLAHFDGAEWTVYSPGDGLPTNDAAAGLGGPPYLPAPMVATADGKLWFSLDRVGLVTFDGDTFTRYGAPALQPGALDLAVDREGRIWVAGWRGALYYIDPQATPAGSPAGEPALIPAGSAACLPTLAPRTADIGCA